MVSQPLCSVDVGVDNEVRRVGFDYRRGTFLTEDVNQVSSLEKLKSKVPGYKRKREERIQRVTDLLETGDGGEVRRASVPAFIQRKFRIKIRN